MISSLAREEMRKNLVALDENFIPHPEGMLAFFRDTGLEPCYNDYGQFCGNIESVWYKFDGRIYKFILEDKTILSAVSINDLEGT